MDIPPELTTRSREAVATRPIVVRTNLDGVDTLLRQVSAVDWSAVHHAYGPATDVPGQLAAVIVGDQETREEAWWHLWGTADSDDEEDAVVALEAWIYSGAD